jgi:hypothetical protein|tara:strand:- start:238 stop:684 length:447 start_codon:yes stop_codon:yes gene_type:complete
MEAKIEGVNIHKQIFATDSRLNYCFIKEDELKDEERGTRLPEFLDRDLIDYDIVVKKAPETEDYTCGLGELDKTLPASYCSIKSVEEGIEWYKHKNPEYPDSFCEILARYTWGKKEDDEEKDKKKKKRKNKKKANKFRVRQGNFKLEF